MSLIFKYMETDDEIRGKAFVHWKSWQEAYSGIVDQRYLDEFTLEKCEKTAFQWKNNVIIAKDGERVAGFVGYGRYRDDELKNAGEVYSIYVLAAYYGQKVGYQLMQKALSELSGYPRVAVWVLKDNARAIKFYQRCGFVFDGREVKIDLGTPLTEVRMILTRFSDQRESDENEIR